MTLSRHSRRWLLLSSLLLLALACTTLRPPAAPDTPTVEAGPTWPVAQQTGLSRSDPFPWGSRAVAETWQAEVRRIVRGAEAWTLLHEANMFNQPPPEGWEYLLVRLWVQCTAPASSGQHSLLFGVTGDRLVLYRSGGAVTPSPQLPYEFAGGQEADGWLVFLIRPEETNLLLRGDELLGTGPEQARYLALQENARLEIDPALLEIKPTATGTDKALPAALGETVTTEDWQVTVVRVYRGSEALRRLQAANPFNKPPAAGLEYLLIFLQVRYIGTKEGPVHLDGFKFKILGSEQKLYNPPALVEPTPELSGYLFPGGELSGWLAMEVDQAREKPLLVFSPALLTNYELRYLSLQP